MNQRIEIERQADRIEIVLAKFRLPARVTGGTVTPRWVRFQVLPAVGAKISAIRNLSEELAAALDAPSCRVSRRGAAVAIEVPRANPQPVRLLPLYHQLTTPHSTIPPLSAILGLADDGAPLLIRLPSPDVAHILVAGTTGSGKTVLLQEMILSLAMKNKPKTTALLLVDPKGCAFSPFERLPHLVRPVITEIDETTEALHSLLHLMEQRTPTLTVQPRIIVVIDELADLLMTGGKEVGYAITRLTQRGRGAGIHLIAATQKPTSAVLGPLVKANFPVRLVGRVTSVEDARTASGWSSTGAERLLGRGDFLAVAEGRVIRFQAGHVTADEIHEVVNAMPGARRLSAPARTTPRLVSPASPVLTLPPTPAPQVDQNRVLAERLIRSHLWAGRHDAERRYRWGFLSEACSLLFDRALEGTWDRQTRQIIALAESISTTTRQKPPNEGPQGGAIPPRE